MRTLVAVLWMATACTSSPKISQDGPAKPGAARGGTESRPETSEKGRATASTATATGAADAKEEAGRNAEGVRVVVAAEDSDALSLVRTERVKAKAEGRTLVVYAGAGWCEPCTRFKNAIHTGSLDPQLGRTTLLAFDADRDTERLGAAGYTFHFIPYVAIPGTDGHPVDSVEARGKGSEAWRELIGRLKAWQAQGR